MKKLDIVFAGTPDISAQILKILCKTKHNIQAVITRPDRPKGRGKKIRFSPVKEVALQNNISIIQPLFLKKNYKIIQQIKELKPEIILVIAYGIIIPKEFLDIPKYGCLNIHFSLLPRWRGAAPIQRAIQAGDKNTGICIIKMDEGLDTGNILSTLIIKIKNSDTSKTLHDKFAKFSIKLLLETLEKVKIIESKPQLGKKLYANKLTKQEGLVDFNKTAWQISCHIRSFTPWPSAFFILNNQQIKIGEFEIIEQHYEKHYGTIINISKFGFDVCTSDKIIRFKKLQFPNKKMLLIHDILNGKNLSQYIGTTIK